MTERTATACVLQLLMLLLTLAQSGCQEPSRPAPRPLQVANTLSPGEQVEGWELLFDGQTTSGWKFHENVAVEDGKLVVSGFADRSNFANLVHAIPNRFELVFEYAVTGDGAAPILEGRWVTGPKDRQGWFGKAQSMLYIANTPFRERLRMPLDKAWEQVVLTFNPSSEYANGVKCDYQHVGSDGDQVQTAQRFPDGTCSMRSFWFDVPENTTIHLRNIRIREIRPASNRVEWMIGAGVAVGALVLGVLAIGSLRRKPAQRTEREDDEPSVVPGDKV